MLVMALTTIYMYIYIFKML